MKDATQIDVVLGATTTPEGAPSAFSTSLSPY